MDTLATGEIPPNQVLRQALQKGSRTIKAGGRFLLGDLLSSLGPQGAPLGAMMLAVPFIQPFSLGPITAPASAVILYLGWRLYSGRMDMGLPVRWLSVPIPERFVCWMRRGAVVLCRRQPAPLASPDASGLPHRRWAALGIALGALLLAVPIPLLPMTNTLPAISIIAFCLAYMYGRRRHFVIGSLSATGAVILFTILGVGLLAGGSAGFEAIQDKLPFLLGD